MNVLRSNGFNTLVDCFADCEHDNDYIFLWLGDMEFKVSPYIRNSIKKVLDNGFLSYPMIRYKPCINAIIKHFKEKWNYDVQDKEIKFTIGSLNSYFPLVN